MIANTHYGYVGKSKAPKFTYTGNYNVRDDGVVELLTSGAIVFLEPKVIDVFMVGGGSAGGGNTSGGQSIGRGGGAGGYTRTVRRITVNTNTQYTVTVGAGGTNYNVAGGSSSFGTFAVLGGEKVYNSLNGGKGGSGGGGAIISSSGYGTGGTDGGAGENGYPAQYTGGEGQGFTTREFGEATGKTYAAGGGGGRYMVAQSPVVSMGGDGGGGSGGWFGTYDYQAPAAGVANTGSGGGGGGVTGSGNHAVNGASGGSGIVCFREAKELPELAGTWVLHERLYAPESNFAELVAYTAGTSLSTIILNMDKISTMASDIGAGNLTLYMRPTGSSSTRGTAVYNFVTNTWVNNTKYKYITFPVGATASSEFRAWLASNATKQ